MNLFGLNSLKLSLFKLFSQSIFTHNYVKQNQVFSQAALPAAWHSMALSPRPTRFQLPPTLKASLALVVGLSAYLAGASRPAWAGQWVIDSFVYSGTTEQKKQELSGGSTGNYVENVTGYGPGPHQSPFDNVSAPIASDDNPNPVIASFSIGANSYFSPRIEYVRPGKVVLNVTMRPVFRWLRDTTYNEEGQEIPKPNDNPDPNTMIYFWEESLGYVDRYDVHNGTGGAPDPLYSTDAPFTGDWLPVSHISNGFMAPLGENTYPAFSPAAVQNHFDTRILTRVPTNKIRTENGKELVDGPPRTFTGVASWSRHPMDFFQQANVSIKVDYTIRMVRFSLSGRRKSADWPYSWSGYSNQVQVAAGGKDSDEHKMEVQLYVTTAPISGDNGSPLPGLPRDKLPTIDLLRAGGVHKGATFKAGTDPVTNANGYILLGEVTSRDLVDDDALSNLTYATIVTAADNYCYLPMQQVWDQGNDFTNDLPLPATYINEIIPMTFKPYIYGLNKPKTPLTKHTMNMLVSNVRVSQWIPETQTMEHKTISLREESPNANFGAPVVVGDTSLYAHFENPTLEDEDGIYKTNLKVHAPKNVTIEQIWLKTQDDNVYRLVPQP